MGSELARQDTGEIVMMEEMPLTIERVMRNVELVHEIMNKLMKAGVHYDVIPGCTKPSLKQEGAEILALGFHFRPEYSTVMRELPGGHREYETTCTLYSISSGAILGQGMGICSTMETKYRYRKAEQTCPKCGAATIVKGKKEYGGGWLCFAKKGGCGAKFADGDPEIENQNMGRVEHDNPADYHHTCLMMSQTRSFKKGTRTATAASEIFTDVEDMPDFQGKRGGAQQTPETPAGQRKVNEAEITKFWTEMSKAKAKNDQVHGYLKETFHIDSVKDIPASSLDMIMGACIAALKPSSDAVATPPEDDESLFGEADEPSPAESKAEVPVVLSGVKVPYGDFKGLDYAELPDSEIAKTIKDLDTEKKLTDPKWGTRNQKILDICRAEAERRMKG